MRMMACVWADSPDSYLSTANDRHNKTQIAVGKAAHIETALQLGRSLGSPRLSLRLGKGYPSSFRRERSIRRYDENVSVWVLRIPSIGDLSVTQLDLSLR